MVRSLLALVFLLPVAVVGDKVCHSIDPRASDAWCNQNCNYKPAPNCPASLCVCTGDPTPAPTPAPPGPPPPTPSPPGPSPPTPTPPGPSPPAPTPPVGPIRGFWDGWVGSRSAKPAPSSGWFFAFPGLAVSPPFKATPYSQIVSPPAWGKYDKNILTQGGGDTGWGDSFYKRMEGYLGDYKPAGWDGVCWDWETAGADHTSAGFNSLMRATKAHTFGLLGAKMQPI